MIAGSIAIICILPWSIRNYRIHKKAIFITTSSAEHFWRGNSRNASGASFTADKRDMLDKAPKAFVDKLYSLDEIGQYELLYKDTWAFICENPGHFMILCAKKFYYFWWFSPQTGMTYPALWAEAYKIYYCFLFLFFVCGVIFALKSLSSEKRVFVLSILLMLLMVSLTHSLFYVEIRHRWAIEPFMLIFASYGVMAAFRRTRGA